MWGIHPFFYTDLQPNNCSITENDTILDIATSESLVKTALSTVVVVTGGGWEAIPVGPRDVVGDVISACGDTVVVAEGKKYTVYKGNTVYAEVLSRKQARFFLTAEGKVFYAENVHKHMVLYEVLDDRAPREMCTAPGATTMYMSDGIFFWPTRRSLVIYDPARSRTTVRRTHERFTFCSRNGHLVAYALRSRSITLAPDFSEAIATLPRTTDRLLAYDTDAKIWVFGTPVGDIVAQQAGKRVFSMRQRFGQVDRKGRAVLFGSGSHHMLAIQFGERIEAIEFESGRLITNEIRKIESLVSDMVLIGGNPYKMVFH